MFYNYRQNNSGGGFTFDEKAGISVNVIVEAASPSAADTRAASLGLYFDGCDSGRDCSCCGDRWSRAGSYDEDPVPSVYGEEVKKDQNFPSKDEGNGFSTKWMDEGTPEGFIHYLNGDVHPFFQNTNPRTTLNGSFGYGVQFNKHGASYFVVDKNGWAADGNHSAPWARHMGSGNMPTKPTIKVLTDNHWGSAWFPTEDEAKEFCEAYDADARDISTRYETTLDDYLKARKGLLKKALEVFRG